MHYLSLLSKDFDHVSVGSIDPIPQVLQGVIDHLVQWRLIPESRKPNSCIINFFDEVRLYLYIVKNSNLKKGQIRR